MHELKLAAVDFKGSWSLLFHSGEHSNDHDFLYFSDSCACEWI